jgi:hypothetical protein
MAATNSGPLRVNSSGSRIEHYGQHGPECFGCKLRTIQFGTHITLPPTHQHKGDPWDGNPVMERIHELQAQGRKVAAMEIANPDNKEQ